MESMKYWVIKHVGFPILIYVFVTLWSTMFKVDGLYANALGVAAGFGIAAFTARRQE